jgi:hypothetical protein
MYNKIRKISIFAACFGFVILHSQTPNVTIQIVSKWGWDTTIVMQNDLITMATVPAIGGRVMQYDLGSLPSIMINSSLLGNTYTPAQNGYYNFGGYKTWPSPQNNWPNSWPPPPKLDYGKYAYQIVSQTADSVIALVTSPVETWVTGNIQFKRRATIFPGTSRVRMEQTIINTGPVLVNWGVWSITQSIVNHTGRTDYQNYWAYFPINPNSLWTSGVSPQGGSAAWQGEVAPGVYGVQFYPENAKIFADPDKGWIAYTSLSDTVVFIRTFPIFDGEQYPDNGARVSVYVSSSSLPLYMEVEVKGPVVALAATGGNYTFTENWLAAKVRAPVLDADSVGAIAGRLSYNLKTQSLSAIYGVFYKGTAKVVFVDAQGNILTEGQSSYTITPLEEFQLQETVAIPGSAKTVEVLVYNSKDELVGVLESADVSQLITAVESKTPAVTSEFRLEANYPNPFNPSTSIRYHLPQAMHVDLSIYNVQGQRIQTLVCAYQTGGDYNVQWNGKVNGITAASGVYFARLSAEGSPGTNVQVQRMLLLK